MRTLDPAQEHTNEGRAQALTDAQHRLWVGKLPHRVGAKSRGPGDRGDREHGDVKGMPWVGHLPGPNVTTGSSAGLSGLCCGQWGRLGSTGPYLVSWAGGQQHVTRASRATCGGGGPSRHTCDSGGAIRCHHHHHRQLQPGHVISDLVELLLGISTRNQETPPRTSLSPFY